MPVITDKGKVFLRGDLLSNVHLSVDIKMRAGRREAAPGEHISRPNKDANYFYYNLIFLAEQ